MKPDPRPRDIPVPDRVKNPVFQKGMLVSANVKIADDGTAMFGKVDSSQVEDMVKRRRCQLCGKRILKYEWCVFIGGWTLIQFQEAPLHVECARYSVQACPHLWNARDHLQFAVCKKYHILEPTPPLWEGEFGPLPTWEGLKPMESLILSIAHNVVEQSEDNPKAYCANHPDNPNMGKLDFDEFMKWSR